MQNDNTDVYYNEYSPDPRLQPYVALYWEVKSTKPLLRPFLYRAVSDSCVDIVIIPARHEYSFINGFLDNYSEYPVGTFFHFYGITLYPGSFSHLFGINVAELSDEMGNLDTFLPKTASYFSKSLDPNHSTPEVIECFNQYFLRLLYSVNPMIDTRFYEALRIIYSNRGIFNPEKQMDLGISPRHLRRLFQHHIGGSPKMFSQVIKFQNILKVKQTNKLQRDSNIFFDLGYYDQSHFIKEFKRFSGKTPNSFFGKKP